MRSAFAIAAFAAGAIAVPFAEQKRQLDYDVEVAYVTDIVTVTAYGPAPTEPPKAPHYGHMSSTVIYEPQPTAPAYQAPPAPVYSAPASPSAPSYGAPSGAAPTDYKSAVIYAHNLHRFNHSASALEWDDELESCAETLAKRCVYQHDVTIGSGGYGQNIAAGVEATNITAVITDMFYNGEEPLYDFYGNEPDMTNFELWGHFTQIVWKATTHVGCYTTTQEDCPTLGGTGTGVPAFFTVCNYGGPGNYAGQYAENVLAPKGEPSATWQDGAYA